jgi:hypothetical protein
MKAKKMSLASVQGKLTRNEMKQIMAGSKRKCDYCAGHMPACCPSTNNCCYDSQGRCCSN